MPIGFRQPENQKCVGRRLSESAIERDQHWFDKVCDLILAQRQSIATIYFPVLEAMQVLPQVVSFAPGMRGRRVSPSDSL